MPIAETGGPAPEELAAHQGSIFLDPRLIIDSTLLTQLVEREKIQTTSRDAREQYAQLYEAAPENVAKLIGKFSAGKALSEDDDKYLKELHILQDTAGAYGDFVGTLGRASDEASTLLVKELGAGYHFIGDHYYSIQDGAWARQWLYRVDDEANATAIFGRNDDIKQEQEPGLRNATTEERAELLLDLHFERTQARALLGQPEASPEAPGVPPLIEVHEDGGVEYPFTSQLIHNASIGFFEDYKDLLPKGKGLIFQYTWSEGGETRATTISFDATEHIKREAIRIDDKGRYYHGPGVFEWQVTRATAAGRETMGFQLAGSRIKPLPVCTFSRDGRLRAVRELTLQEITTMWGVIKSKTDTPKFRREASHMRGEGVETGGTESLAERRQKVLVALGRIDLIEVDVTDTDLAKTIDRSNEYQSAKDREIEKARTALETQIFESLGRVDLVVPHRPRVPESDTSTSSSVPSFKGTLMDLQALADSFYPKPAVPVSPSSLFVRLEGPAEMMEASKSPRRKVIELFLQFVLGLKSSGRARY